MSMFWQGAVAGLAIAVPVGPIGVLIVDRGIRNGWTDALAAGLGTASADLFYAAAAVTLGAASAELLAPVTTPLRVAAVVVLVAIAARNLARALRPSNGDAPDVRASAPLRTFATFLGLTVLNPVTIVYFASLVIGLDVGDAAPGAKVAFVAGAGGASAAWQTALATGGAWAGARLDDRVRRATSIAGSVVIVLLALRMALSL